MRNWTPGEINFLQQRLSNPTAVIYELFLEQFGEIRTYNSVQKKVKKLKDAYSEESDNEDVVSNPEVFTPTQLAMPFTPHITAAEKREAREDVASWLQDAVKFAQEEMPSLAMLQRSAGVQSQESSLVICLSDTHFGKHTKKYNLEIARQRILSIPENIYRSARPSVDEVVVCLVGDMVEGEDIYATQNNHIEVPVIDQTTAAAEAIWQMLVLTNNLFNCPVRVEVAPGNHGRMSKTANEKSNWDNILYFILKVMAEMNGNSDIVVNMNYDEFLTFPVKDRVGLLYHKGVKHTGTPAMKVKLAGWAVSKGFDFLVHGHWHNFQIGNWLGRIVVGNGCMCGSDDLAEQLALEDKARQAHFFVTPGQPLNGFGFTEWVDGAA